MKKNNKQIVYGLTSLVISVGVILILLFNVLVYYYIDNNARRSLTLLSYDGIDYQIWFNKEPAMRDGDGDKLEIIDEYNPLLFDAYIIDYSTSVPQVLPTEELLLEYYNSNKEKLDNKRIHIYHKGPYKIYFKVEHDLFLENKNKGSLLYVNVSPMVGLLNTLNKILVLVMLAITLCVIIIARKMTAFLDEQDQRVKSFFSNVSHELKTPIMAIQGYAEGCLENVVDSKKAATVILKESDRMSSLVGDILELSKIDSGAVGINKVNNDIREIIYDVLDSSHAIKQEKGIKIHLEMEEPLMALCDEAMMHSVISNIVGNGLRYATTQLIISAKGMAGKIIIEIANDGQPIAKEDLGHIFKRFYKGMDGQTGIGLALAKEYMELHKANLYVISSEDETRFTLEVPTGRG